MKTLMAIMMVTLIAATALNSPPLREGAGEGEGAEQQKCSVQVVNSNQGNTLPQGRRVQNEPADNTTTFATIDITIDPLGQSLGAYQFELTVNHGSFMVVGIEAGEHAAFDHDRPPYYDRKAEQHHTDKLIIAEYALPTVAAKDLPTTPIRVVTVHFAILEHAVGPGPQTLQLTLTTAGNADGERIDANISYSFRTPERPQ